MSQATLLAFCLSLAAMLLAGPLQRVAGGAVQMPSDAQIKRIEEAMPAEPVAKPAAPRKVLVWGRFEAHEPNPYAAKALEIMGRKTGAFEAVVGQDPEDLRADRLKTFDALVMNNVHQRDPFLPADFGKLAKAEQEAAQRHVEQLRKGILDFVAGGKGLVGIHAATAAFQTWPEYGRMMGGYYSGHIAEEVPIKLDEPGHPLVAMFGGQGFRINDEIYFFGKLYSRGSVRVLLSLDLAKMKDPGKRADKDYAVSWIRTWEKGRVFYCSLGHAASTYWTPAVLRHCLAGIQFALGDLAADATPRPSGE